MKSQLFIVIGFGLILGGCAGVSTTRDEFTGETVTSAKNNWIYQSLIGPERMRLDLHRFEKENSPTRYEFEVAVADYASPSLRKEQGLMFLCDSTLLKYDASTVGQPSEVEGQFQEARYPVTDVKALKKCLETSKQVKVRAVGTSREYSDTLTQGEIKLLLEPINISATAE